jgi:phosphonate transport system substrate-binding protein
MSRRRALVMVFALLALVALGATTTGCGTEEEAEGGESTTLRVALVPNLEPEKVKAVYEPLAKEMERELGKTVELSVPTSYPAVVEAMANGKVDLALFGGLTYVQARERAGVTPLVTDINPETGTTRYESDIIVPADSPVQNIGQLRGKTFAFGSVSSTSGSLYPAIMLHDAGIDYRKDLGRTLYTGGHDTTAAAVASGKVDAGGVEGRILRRLIKKGTVDGSKIRVIQKSAPIEGYPWVVRDSIDDGLKQRIADMFVGLRDPKLLDLLSAKGYERVQSSDYDYIEQKADELGLLTRTK